MWLRRRRHDLLELDDTIAYDSEEQEMDDRPEARPVAKGHNPREDRLLQQGHSSTGIRGSGSIPNSADGVDRVEELMSSMPSTGPTPGLVQTNRKTRSGREVHQPRFLQDYEG